MIYYSIAEVARKTNLTTRTIRFYINNGLISSIYSNERNMQVIEEREFFTIQMIQLLKSASFTLKQIKEILENNSFKEQLELQKDILLKQIVKKQALIDMIENMNSNSTDYYSMYQVYLQQKHFNIQFGQTKPLNQRISYHERYSKEKESWQQWLLKHYQFKDNDKILEIGCGNGALWIENKEDIPSTIELTLIDTSEAMIEATKKIANYPQVKSILLNDAHHLDFADHSFDSVIINHVLMYFEDIDIVLKEIYRVLKPNGNLYCSTISCQHNKEMQEIATRFNSKIQLGNSTLSNNFSLENGKEKLSPYFKDIESHVRSLIYEVDDADILSDYMLSTKWIGNIQDVLEYQEQSLKDFVHLEMKKRKGIIKVSNICGMFSCIKRQ